MLIRLILIILFFQFALALQAQQAYWQQQADCNIDVTLDDKAHTLDGYIRITYHNNAPDTLHYIWFHLWPNAYKNDRTAFCDQMLGNGNTDFYFSDNDRRGYINRLDFKVNGAVVRMEDHPQHQDIIKIILQKPLMPGANCIIETPFHVQLPHNFSRGGHQKQAYQITQWYPKPAVYDAKGWHPMPYLDQGEFYSEFGNYTVEITVPKAYIVAAAGEKLGEHSTATTTTLQYSLKQAHDFAWFADKTFTVQEDTITLPSGRVIKTFVYTLPFGKKENIWKDALKYTRQSVLARSKWLGEYPYPTVSVVQAALDYTGGMEYPTITVIAGPKSAHALEAVIEHEVGHNWLYGILASNERDYPWMDEGMNSFYTARYKKEAALTLAPAPPRGFIASRMPLDKKGFALHHAIVSKTDQPIETASEKLSVLNYGNIAYQKGMYWMAYAESVLGRRMFDTVMQTYYHRWKFKHPSPEDFKKVVEEVSGSNADTLFNLLSQKGPIPGMYDRHNTKFTSFFSFKETDKYKYIFAAPVAGFNYYDKLMLGLALHNYTLPEEKLQFALAPMYAAGSKQLNGIGRISYTWLPGNDGARLQLALAASTFSRNDFVDSSGKKTALRFSKIAPALRYVFANKHPRSTLHRYIQWKTFFISEQGLRFTRDTIGQKDVITYPFFSRYVNELQLVWENNRALYPYSMQLQANQGSDFVRLAFTGNYFFNYAGGGGFNVRFFAGKFLYLGAKTIRKQVATAMYHLNMSGPVGDEDFTYSNYFIGRNEFEGLASQQVIERDGFFKVKTDLLSNKAGKTDNWLMAVNFTTDVPDRLNPLRVLPFKMPLKVFLDAGTYAEAWQKDAPTGKLLYDAGLQVSLFRNIVNVYVPLFYSEVYRSYINSIIVDKRFLRKISFSIDIQKITAKKLFPQLVY
ncbi:MAG TPA: M1 family metallopeptidase [Ferruginibacter sp.]|nr:M1 family metallopeptidase [Ferruginibacter sp.]HMP20263.1 M1 family metallopeptidase [Ferruginibacter sp.]